MLKNETKRTRKVFYCFFMAAQADKLHHPIKSNNINQSIKMVAIVRTSKRLKKTKKMKKTKKRKKIKTMPLKTTVW